MELRNSGTEGMETKKKKKTSPAEQLWFLAR
jgi:hypothetical protein